MLSIGRFPTICEIDCVRLYNRLARHSSSKETKKAQINRRAKKAQGIMPPHASRERTNSAPNHPNAARNTIIPTMFWLYQMQTLESDRSMTILPNFSGQSSSRSTSPAISEEVSAFVSFSGGHRHHLAV
jgi:hypothetical protein